MRDNGPVTQVERPFPRGRTIVSKTDLSGRITEVNDAFVEASGYASDELVGKPHSIVRHPDVPAAVFAHMWRTLRKDRPWRGVIKNRCKNGDHYWVDAYVVPLRAGGTTVGYMSARMEPSPAQIEAANAQYRAVAGGAAIGGGGLRAPWLSVRNGVLFGVLFFLAVALFGAVVAVRGIERGTTMVYQLQRYNDVAAMVTRNNQRAAAVQAELLLALQQGQAGTGLADPQKPLQRVGDSVARFDESIGHIADNRRLLRDGAGAAGNLHDAAIERYLKASRALIADGVKPLVELIAQRRFEPAQQAFAASTAPLVATMNAEAQTVSHGLLASALDLRRQVDDLYELTVRLVIGWLVVTVAAVVLGSVAFFRATIRPLDKAIAQMERIAEGKLSERADVFGFAEPGKVLHAVALMQVQLKVMLDEIQSASSAIERQVQQLNSTVVAVVNSTEEQFQQAVQIQASVADSGADTQRLAQCAGEAFAQLRRLADGEAPIDAAQLDGLVRLTHETATLAGLNGVAAQEIERLSHRIISLAAENREYSNDAWNVGTKLGETSSRLHAMLEKFD